MIDQCHSETELVNYTVGQWPIFHGPFIFPYIIVIDFKNILWLKKMTPARGIPDPLGTCSSYKGHIAWDSKQEVAKVVSFIKNINEKKKK